MSCDFEDDIDGEAIQCRDSLLVHVGIPDRKLLFKKADGVWAVEEAENL
jgi:hypothetical protein